jgi:hypothetical protein
MLEKYFRELQHYQSKQKNSYNENKSIKNINNSVIVC